MTGACSTRPFSVDERTSDTAHEIFLARHDETDHRPGDDALAARLCERAGLAAQPGGTGRHADRGASARRRRRRQGRPRRHVALHGRRQQHGRSERSGGHVRGDARRQRHARRAGAGLAARDHRRLHGFECQHACDLGRLGPARQRFRPAGADRHVGVVGVDDPGRQCHDRHGRRVHLHGAGRVRGRRLVLVHREQRAEQRRRLGHGSSLYAARGPGGQLRHAPRDAADGRRQRRAGQRRALGRLDHGVCPGQLTRRQRVVERRWRVHV